MTPSIDADGVILRWPPPGVHRVARNSQWAQDGLRWPGRCRAWVYGRMCGGAIWSWKTFNATCERCGRMWRKR